MTSSRMENPLWKKLQNDPTLLKYQQQMSNPEASLALNGSSTASLNELDNQNVDINNLQSLLLANTPSMMAQLSPESLFKQQQQHQQQQQQLQSYSSLLDHQNQQFNNLQQFITSQQQKQQQTDFYNGDNGNLLLSDYSLNSSSMKREHGLVEKLVGSYGFIKFLDREGRLFFHYSSFQSSTGYELKVGDLVEFEEGIDKRNGKPIAVNLTRFSANGSSSVNSSNSTSTKQANPEQLISNIDSQLNLMNLKELLLKNNSSSNENLYQQQQQQQFQQQNYQNLFKMMQQQQQQQQPQVNETANNLNSIMNLFNKENIFNQMNMNANLLNMTKTASASAIMNGNDNLANLAKMFNVNTTNQSFDVKQQLLLNSSNANASNKNSEEQMEGTIAIVATKRPNLANFNNLAQQLDGRITYQRSGETFYIPYSLSDVVTSNVTLRIGDRVKFFIAHLLNPQQQQQAQQLPVVTTYYARKVELLQQQDFLSDLAQQLLQQQQPKQVYRGIITTLKDSFGKIEREDMFKETFFHFSEYRGQNANQELRLGLNVEFEIQDRHGKEIACNIRMLNDGTVAFDDLTSQVYIGRIVQPLTKINSSSNFNIGLAGTYSSIGRLIYDSNTSNSNINNGETLVELSFTDRDRIAGVGEYTLLEGDFVQFRIATDKRRKVNPQHAYYQRATQITLIEEHSLVENSINTNEHRERGVLVKLFNASDLVSSSAAAQSNLDTDLLKQQQYGAIQCLEQSELVYFSLSEVINYARFKPNSLAYSINDVKLELGDSLEFSVVKCGKDVVFKTGLRAIRLRQLARNSVQFEIVSTETYNGYIEREPTQETQGQIRCDHKNGSSQAKTIVYNYSDENCVFNLGDKIKFNMSTCLKSKKQAALNLKLVEAFREQGLVAYLKDNCGYIEILSQHHKSKNVKTLREIYFTNASNDLQVGDLVEFNINKKSRQNVFAENIAKLAAKKQVKLFNNLSSTVHKGKVVQQVKYQQTSPKTSDIDQSKANDEDYYGKIQLIQSGNERKDSVGSSSTDNQTYSFGLFSLNDKKVNLQVGDVVSFQLATCFDGVKRIFNLQQASEQQQQQTSTNRQQRNSTNANDLKKGKIETIKGNVGFIEYQTSDYEKKKAFFHISDLIDENTGTTTSTSESSNIKIGDEVEFVLSYNSRSNKYSAIKIKKLNKNSESSGANSKAEDKRPEHLITKLKVANIDDKSGKQLILTRQPNNPDGKLKSFSRQLFEREPGSLEPKPSVSSNMDLVTAESRASSNDNENQTSVSPLSITDLIMTDLS